MCMYFFHGLLMAMTLDHFEDLHLYVRQCGDVVAKWIVHGTLNMQIVGLNLSAASWLTM